MPLTRRVRHDVALMVFVTCLSALPLLQDAYIFFYSLKWFFFVLYFLEIGFRWIADGLLGFWTKLQNLFDFALFAIGVADMTVSTHALALEAYWDDARLSGILVV